MLLLRDFFIEERLEKYRLTSSCNLGESGIRNIKLSELMNLLGMDMSMLEAISLSDSPNQGRLELREEVSILYDNVHPDEVLITTGTSEALFILFHLFIQKGDTVGLFLPAFQALYEIPLALGAKLQAIQAIDHLDIRRLLEGNNKLTIINHPHNPTGFSLKEEDISYLKNLSIQENQFLLFDEHYRFLDLEDDLTFSGANLQTNTFATGSITKCFGVVGLRIGWLIGNKKFISQARSFKDYLTHTVNPISEFLTIEILKNRKNLVRPIKERIQRNIQYFRNSLQSIPSIQTFHPPTQGVVSFPKLKKDMNSEVYADKLLEHCSVFVLPGSNFEQDGNIRIGFGETIEKFRSGIDRWVNWDNKI